MRSAFLILFTLVAVFVGGTACRTSRKSSSDPIVTPAKGVAGKVQSVNGPGRFAVVSFPIGLLPTAETRLGAYRAGLKVGELKVSNQRLDLNVIAEIMSGECQPGDEVKD